MTQFQHYLAIVAAGIAAACLAVGTFGHGLPIGLQVFAWASVLLLARFVVPVPVVLDCLVAGFGLGALLAAAGVEAGPAHWLALIAVWLMTWLALERSATHRSASRWRILLPIAFGLILLILWEVIVTWASVPRVILPPPSAIWARIVVTSHLLWADFQQTFLKSVLAGYAIGCGAGFVVAILIDRSDFLRRGLMPVGNFVSALPIVGIAPIMVMWFGFDWQSKAAVVVVMTFFPMLVNTLAGLAVAGSMERDLMSTYAASPWQTLIKLRLPAAAPFIFNALKINSTLALIGAIVAEFFGTPTVGMGFRISTEVGRMNIDMVWAEIALAALAGSAFYGVVVLIERATTFWHPSVRSA